MTNAILVLNAGSSSLKFAVYPEKDDDKGALLRGQIAGIGTQPTFSARDAAGNSAPQGDFEKMDDAVGSDTVIAMLIEWLNSYLGDVKIKAAGHRVVHGGRQFKGPALVTDALIAQLAELIPLAPIHQEQNLNAIACVAASAPDLMQVVCFDTSFHQTQHPLAKMFALPRDLTEEGVIRYGFHGLSYEYIASVLPKHIEDKANGRVIVAHLGSGASMCAMKDGRSAATSMGFTTLDGLVMGRRCGAIDPGVLLYLMQSKGMGATEIENLLYRESGLFGVSGISNDMGVLETSTDPHAREAIDLFCFRAARELTALVTSIGGLDALVFTAGIGENSAMVRAGICAHLEWMGVEIAADENAQNAVRISPQGAKIDVLVIPTDEEAVIARATHALTNC